MRRLLSILLLLGLIAGPAFEAIPAHALASGWTGRIDESAVPACCRRNGRHHCTMAAPERQTTVSSSECCPCSDHIAATTVPNNGLSAASRVGLPLPVVTDKAAGLKAPAKPLTAEGGIETGRGPPSSHLT